MISSTPVDTDRYKSPTADIHNPVDTNVPGLATQKPRRRFSSCGCEAAYRGAMRYLRYEELPPVRGKTSRPHLRMERSKSDPRPCFDLRSMMPTPRLRRNLRSGARPTTGRGSTVLGSSARPTGRGIHDGVLDDTVGRLRSLREDPHLAGDVPTRSRTSGSTRVS